MDNRSKPFQIFGTPLSKSLDNDPQESFSGPINRRRARLDRQQIVQDEQGRRRFHGAFTGGFSAGYHGTVGTVQGFRPKTFSVHRGNKKHDGGESSSIRFEHKPEDYMDDEDFAEFGIAPKKVRLAGNFSDSSATLLGRDIQNSRNARSSLVVAESIGEKILRCMAGRRWFNDSATDQPIRQKTDFHGLGYKPLIESRPGTRHIKRTGENPLIVSLDHGKRLKISGEAFGEGVLDDDEDNVYGTNEYGYDNMDNYEFPKSRSLASDKIKKPSVELDKRLDLSNDDQHLIDGFVLANDLEAQKICDNDRLKYPTPVIEANWQMPVRSEPIELHRRESELSRQKLNLYHGQSGSFNEKFTKSTAKLMKCDSDIESRVGLVSYSHLKALETKSKTSDEVVQDLGNSSISIDHRRVIEWRPCSLLCKHFEVQNPYPDNAYCGSKPVDLVFPSDALPSEPFTQKAESCSDKLAPIELRRSIFNISFDETKSSSENESDGSEDDPQVIQCDLEVKSMNPDYNQKNNCHFASARNRDTIDGSEQKESDQESDIILVDAPKPEPEVIVLSSSSSASGCSTPVTDRDDKDEEQDDDIYGPPLPPTREILKDLDRCASKSYQSTSQFSSKFKVKQAKKKKKSKNKKHKSKKSADRKV